MRSTVLKTCLTIIVLLSMSTAALADGIAIGGRVGTPGLGVELTAQLIPSRVNARVGFNLFEYTYSAEEDDIEYDLNLHLQSFSALIDVYPAGGFRMTGGLFLNGTNIDGVGVPRGSYEIGGTTYPAALVGTLTADVEFNSVAPYLGIGAGNAVGANKQLSFSFDVGVIFQGSANATLAATGPISLLPSFQADLAEEEDSLNEDLDPYKYYPVVGFSIGYQF